MSEGDVLEEGLTLFASILTQIKEASIDIMRVHPVNGLLMMHLLGNIGYTIFAVPDENGMYMLGQFGIFGDKPSVLSPVFRFNSKQELMSFCFRSVATNAGMLLKGDVVTDLFSAFNLGKIVELIK